MLEGIQELAGNKLLLLYIFNRTNIPISNNQITDLILENNLLNYFSLQQYISELTDAGFLNLTREDKKQLYTISSKGKITLEYFENRIDASKKKIIDAYFSRRNDINNQTYKAIADYYPGDEGYVVSCKLLENERTLIEIVLNTPSVDRAKLICAKWKMGGEKKYKNITSLLTD